MDPGAAVCGAHSGAAESPQAGWASGVPRLLGKVAVFQ